ncbi:MAG: hypothetical protein WAN87_02900 [Thermoplasmata archaeon]
MDERLSPDGRRNSGTGSKGPILGIELTQGIVSGEGTGRRTRLFHRALSIGIGMFDLTASTTPLLDARLIKDSNREFHRTLTLVASAQGRGHPASERIARSEPPDSTSVESIPSTEATLLHAIGENAGPEGRLWIEISPNDSESSSHSELTAAFPAPLKGATASWVFRWDSPAELDLALQRARRLGGAMVSGPASLLDPRGPAAVAAISPPGVRPYLARDPFAGGRLDGSLLEAGNLDRRPNYGPWSLERLQEEYGPVLALGFLAKRGVRNLRVAALQYMLTLPTVAGIVVPISTDRQLDELERLPSAPPLGAADLERIAQLQTRRRTA